MKTLMNEARAFARGDGILRDQRGLSTVEYVIILVLIAALAVGLWKTLGEKVRAKIDYATGEMDKLEETDVAERR